MPFCRFLTGICLLVLFPLQAQVRISGQLRDSSGYAPVAFASFIVKGGTEGGLTDAFGRYQVTVKKLPVTLVFNALGYERLEASIGDTSARQLTIRRKPLQLSEVSITPDKVETLHAKDAFSFLDYRFYDDYLLALTGKRGTNRKYLLLIDPDGKTLSSLQVNANAESLYSDCLGAVHFETPDSVFQVYYDYEKLRLLYSSTRDTFMQLMTPCKCQVEDYYYFGWPRYRALKLDYYSINWYHKGEYVPLRSISDSSKIKGFQQNYDLQYFLERRRQRPAPDPRYAVPVDFLQQHLDSFRLTEKLSEADQRWLTPVKAPLYRVGKEIIIFNYIDTLIERYDKSGQKLSEAPFTLEKDKRLQDDFLVDDITNEIYGIVEHDGISELKRIDVQTGLVKKTFTVPDRTYITHPLVRNGVLYFLWHDPSDDQPRKISKMYLD